MCVFLHGLCAYVTNNLCDLRKDQRYLRETKSIDNQYSILSYIQRMFRHTTFILADTPCVRE